MPKAPETTQTATASSLTGCERATPGPGSFIFPPSVICDLSEARGFYPTHNTPHVPVLAAFGGDRLHVCRLEGSWDLERAVSENSDALIRSIRMLPRKPTLAGLDDLTFQFGPRAFLCADKNRIVGYASTPEEAERLVTHFSKTYRKPPAATGGTFHLIAQGRTEISCHSVTLPADTFLSPEALGLHYGNGSGEWHQDLVAKLSNRNHGLSIFEGRPGTGKSFYLRHLMGVLQESHRFYFIPTAILGVLSKPEFIGFWAEQRRSHARRKFVVILEDSDAALMTRGADNREQVSAILNLSDGMLADFLRLHLICTINCSATDLDPALLRPGRLLCHRVFGRLDYAQAVRLAETLGRKLPMPGDYSLAEIFAENEKQEISRPRIGFAA
ncbi:MAG: AAA family ATPase [Verrucomicrobia bacterium]|nr:AAA family ATPase [Verrucomicrobiota bacterium]